MTFEVTVLGEVYCLISHLHKKRLVSYDYVDCSGSEGIGRGRTIVVPLKADRISTPKPATDVTQTLHNPAMSALVLTTSNVLLDPTDAHQ